MDERHPKRRKDKYNSYTLTVADGRFYLALQDGQGVTHEMEIDSELYALLDSFELEDLSYLNEWDRHIEQSELSEAMMERRMLQSTCYVEEVVYRNIRDEQLYKAIKSLPEMQRRRLILYFFLRFYI